MPLGEHVYCVAVAFKMTEWIGQPICIKFCVKLKHSSMETIQRIQKTAAKGNCWLAASSRQHTHSHITSCAEIFGETRDHPGDSVPLQPRFGILWLLAFPKTKITFEMEEMSDPSIRFRKIWQGSWWQLGELCEVPRCLLWRKLSHHCPMYNVSCIFYLHQ